MFFKTTITAAGPRLAALLPPVAASLVYTVLPRVVQKVSELHLARDDLAAVNRELTQEIGQLKAELTTVIEERDQANINLQTVR